MRETEEYRRLRTGLADQGSYYEFGLFDSAVPYLLASVQQDLNAPVCLLVADPDQAAALREELAQWVPPGTEVKGIPEPDFPYADPGGLASPPMIARAQLASYLALHEPRHSGLVIVASVLACIGAMRPPGEIALTTVELERGTSIRPSDLLLKLEHMGYERVEFATRTGEMSARGGIVDVFSAAHDEPFRIEFFGNEVESLRYFDPVTQRTTRPAEQVRATTMSAQGSTASILDYLPSDTIIALKDPQSLRLRSLRLDAELAESTTANDKNGTQIGTTAAFLRWSDIESKIKSMRRLFLLPWKDESEDTKTRLFISATSYAQRMPVLFEEVAHALAQKERVVLVSLQAQRLQELLEEAGLNVPLVRELEAVPPPGSLILLEGSIGRGWVLRGRLRVLSDLEIFGFVKQARRLTKVRERPAPFSLTFSPGDLVAHVDHGIGRFVGLTTLSTGDIEHEYLEIAYLGGDTLYVPTDQIHRVTRYIGGEHAPTLSRLGSAEWESAKQRARQSTRTLARELIELYARRQMSVGHSFSRDTVWQREMEASFPYIETPDQMEAIDAVKHDMESTRPMDRLICGDVGYGKTEIALRAAFKAVMDGKQVAILTPTTILAQQHYATFTERLAAFPVRTEVLSRFSTPDQESNTLGGVATGAVDICIGTHRLLQKDVNFNDLGLLIVDEEQRFGVLQKESLRSLKTGLDALTLSATPIPRTLHMSLAGIRDMCTMETPPEERLAVRTHVGPYNSTLVRQAILREVDRSGQVFFVHNRIATIDAVLQALKGLVPEARFSIAHGRMRENELERTMAAFAAHEIDVLVTTTIIQLGLDMPNANTLIVNQADRLGLTQLYQLRGRVGRGRHQAYAYFFFERRKELTPQANRRLDTIFEANELGAGLEIALRDLEIRGTGSLLGTRQSGHITAIGFELYCQILAEEVRRLQDGITDDVQEPVSKVAPALDLPVSAYIPEQYVPQPATRIILYKKLADASRDEHLAAIEAEMRDRFGPLPATVKELLFVARIRIMATAANVKSITRMGSDLVIIPERMASLAVHLDLGPGVRAGNEQVRISTARTGGKWRTLLEMLLRNTNEGRQDAPR